jgi:hypothetical protein
MADQSFYEAVVEAESFRENANTGTFIATEHTASPWNADHQHAGPAVALMIRCAEALAVPAANPLTTQVAVDILSPIPRAAVAVTARVIKAGELAALVEAEMTVAGLDQIVARLSAWRIRRSPNVLDAAMGPYRPAPEPGELSPPHQMWGRGYVDAMEWRVAEGDVAIAGPTTVWARPRVNLIDDEPVRGVELVALLADAASGVSALADPRELVFLNTDLSLHIVREPRGDSVWMHAESFLSDDGVGMTSSVLGDANGSLATAQQALFVGRLGDSS